MLGDLKTKIPPPAFSYSSMGKTSDATSTLGKASRQKAAQRNDGVDCGQYRRPKNGAGGSSSQNWEGIDLIDTILAEVNKRHGRKNPRGETLLSSPRISPAIVERDTSEGADVLMRNFVKETAMKMDNLQSMPAARAVIQQESRLGMLEDEEDDADQHYGGPGAQESQVRKRFNSGKNKKSMPTAAFLSSDRPHPGKELLNRGPSVGKYTPHFGVVERKHPGVTITNSTRSVGELGTGGLNGGLREGRSNSPTDRSGARSPVGGGGSTFELTQTGGGLSNTADTLLATFGKRVVGKGVQQEDPDGKTVTKEEGGAGATNINGNKNNSSLEPTDSGVSAYRKHAIRDCSSAFKSVGRKEEKPVTTDVDYWPYPQPGTTQYARGRMTPGTRITTADMRSGCGANTMYYVEDRYEPKSVVNFDRSESRAAALRSPSTGVAPQVLQYVVNTDVLSTKSRRAKGSTSFKHQQGRPQTVTPSLGHNAEPLGLYHESVATRQKKGYVNLGRNSRINGGGDDDHSIFEQVSDEKQPLTVDDSLVQRRAASVSFSRAEKKSIVGTSRVDETEYNPNFSAIARRRPVANMAGITREAPVIGEKSSSDGGGRIDASGRRSEVELDTGRYDRLRHVTTPTMGSQLSRDSRNKVLSPATHASDVVYDIPPPKPNAITFSRLKRH